MLHYFFIKTKVVVNLPVYPGAVLPHQTLNEPDTTLYLTDGGEILPINLQTLEDAPDDIIATLRVSARHPVDCGKWIMVGATYRGRGNLQAAIAVITAMIEGEPLSRHSAHVMPLPIDDPLPPPMQ